MSMTGTWLGAAGVHAKLRTMMAETDIVSKTIVARVAADTVQKAQSNFEGSHRRGSPHVGGNKPNVVSGDLRRSIKYDPVIRHGFGDYGTSVGPRMVYGRRVELGMNGSHAYPYFTPAAKAARQDMTRIAAETWLRYLR